MEKLRLLSLLAIMGFVGLFAAQKTQAATVNNIDADITAATTWKKEGSPYVIRNGINITAPLTIEPGVVVKFDYHKGAALNVKNELNAVGTESDKIIFTSIRDDSFGGDTNDDGDLTKPSAGDWMYIQFYAGSTGNIEHSSILYALDRSTVLGGVTINSTNNISIKNSEIKYCGFSGIFIYNAQPTVENNIISNNGVGVFLWSNIKTKISHNTIVGNDAGASVMSPKSIDQLDARDNWWGDKSGPYYQHRFFGTDNLGGKGNKVSDGVLFDPWLQKDPSFVRKPLIIVPGVGAAVNPDLMISGVMNDNWTLFDHTYDGLIESLKSIGYIEGKDLFIAYYDWRKSNEESAQKYLKPLIQKANILNGTSKVNIVAHSMGGLLARSYIQGNNYLNDVDNLILIATPNHGSSDAYSVWEGGRVPGNWDNRSTMRSYINYMKVKNLTLGSYDVVHQYIPSIKDLMSVYDYIYNKETPTQYKNYLGMNEKNNFLINLNQNTEVLNNRVKLGVILGDGQSTVNDIPIVDQESEDGKLWADGKPEPLDPQKNDTRGDGRVLLSSGDISAKFKEILNYKHDDIVSQSEKIVATTLGEDSGEIKLSPDISSELGIWFASPVDVEIKSPDGKIISKDVNDISLAKYASESKDDGFKIISIPNPTKGDYEIKITGNGDGAYHIGSEFSSYDEGMVDASSLAEGQIKKGEKREYKVSYNPENKENPVEDIKIKDTTPPAISLVSIKDQTKFQNDQSINIQFEATDNVSPQNKIQKEVFWDGEKIEKPGIDLSLFPLGKHIIKITATDEARNKAEKEIQIETITSVQALKSNVSHYYTLNLIKNSQEKTLLLNHLNMIQDRIEKVNKFLSTPNLNPRIEEVFQKLLAMQTNQHLDMLIRRVSLLSKQYDPKVQTLLLESLRFLKM